MTAYAVGFARPDRWAWGKPAEETSPWHAVEAHRPADELDGEVELAVCGAIVQVWGSREWGRVAAGRSACATCRQLTGVAALPEPQPVSAAGR
jgi:hypothetical protein